MAAAGERQGVGEAAVGKRRMAGPLEFHVDETAVERGIVRHQPAVGDEFEERAGNGGKDGFVAQKGVAQAMDRLGIGRHGAFGIDVFVERAPGGNVIQQLDAADLHQPVAGGRIQAGRFGIEHDLAHGATVGGDGPGCKAVWHLCPEKAADHRRRPWQARSGDPVAGSADAAWPTMAA